MISVKVYKAIFWLLLLAVVILSLMSIDTQQIFVWQDKVHHLVAYGVLFWCLLGAYEKQQNIWFLGILLTIFSGLIEVSQSYTGHRQAELMDLLANGTGILSVALIRVLKRRF
jgi:VanZ family protein